jgi:hypothetical protein
MIANAMNCYFANKMFWIIGLDILISIIIGRILFGNFKNLIRSIYYLLLPDIVSLFKGDFDNDFNFTYKLLLFLGIMSTIVFIEIRIFY